VGGLNTTVFGAVLRYAGLYQANIRLPVSLPVGDLPIKWFRAVTNHQMAYWSISLL